MIDVKELRIGNIIRFDDVSDDIVKVTGISFSTGSWFVDWEMVKGTSGFEKGDSLLQEFEPIPLTPEILGKAGFRWNTQRSYEKYGACHFVINYKEEVNEEGEPETYLSNRIFYIWYGDGVFKFYFCSSEIEIKYIHQVQNLYYALTQTELNIQL